jgi:hypothetical protein
MCQTCNTLQQAIDNAKRNNDAEKARVLSVVLSGHQRTTCQKRLIRQLWANVEVTQ